VSAFRVLDDYPRRSHLEFYRRYPCPFYAVTFELDVGELRAQLAGRSVYAGCCWALHRALLGVDAFRVRLRGDEVVLHDGLRLGLTAPAPRRTFAFVDLDWDPDPAGFLAAAADGFARAAAGGALAGGDAPDFAYYTALPGVPFTGFTHAPLPDPTAGQPMIAFGRFQARDGRTVVPVGIQVNHMYVDGADLGELYEAARAGFLRGLAP
jgi:chloramphenicol O-acetyltransferase type A